MLEYAEEQFEQGRVMPYDELRSESLPRWNHLTKSTREKYKEKAFLKKDEITKAIDSIHLHDAKVAQKKREQNNEKNRLVKEYLHKKTRISGMVLKYSNIFSLLIHP